MKKLKAFSLAVILVILTTLCLCFGLVGCANNDNDVPTDTTPDATPDKIPDKTPEGTSGNVLVAYFSATNVTKGVAEKIAAASDGALYAITPKQPYTSADLDYRNTNSRSTKEQNDSAARPEITGSVENIEQYDVIFIGYPIWHGQAPKIIYTFLESYNFSGKTIIPFCTSASSGMGSSATNLRGLTTGATWKEGRRFSSSATQSQVEDWIESENYIVSEVTKMYITINKNKMEVELAKNSSVDALVEILRKGSITYTANDYGGFEKVGSLGHTLPTNNADITTEAGDVILYSGNQIVLFYGRNSWSYTRLGKINGYSAAELRELLAAGKGSVQVTISLN